MFCNGCKEDKPDVQYGYCSLCRDFLDDAAKQQEQIEKEIERTQDELSSSRTS